jgi:F-type H+-transporting ATPase subunit delta
MTELTTLARPYAVAAYRRAKETKTTERWSDELAFVTIVMEDQRMKLAASNPRVRKEAFTASFLALCEGRLSSEAQNFVRLLVDNGRLDLIGEIASLFEEYRAADEGYVNVDVASAFDMTDAEQKKLAQVLDGALGKKAHLSVRTDNSLIGGVYIKAGDRVIDASIKGQLERLAKNLWN